jgi:hypothetical protein
MSSSISICAHWTTPAITPTHTSGSTAPLTTWCPWINIDGYILYGGCFFWNFDDSEDVTKFYGPAADSMQIAWSMLDVSSPGDFCEGKHKWSDNILDNVSIGFYDGTATQFQARGIDIFQDTFHDSFCAFNSFFDTYDDDTLATYAVGPSGYPAVPLRKDRKLYATIGDKDSIADIRLYGSDDRGATWNFVNMNLDNPSDPDDPDLGGDFYGTLCPGDFGYSKWPTGTDIWYYVRVEDNGGELAYWPGDADPFDPDHTGTAADYFGFSILPFYPTTFAPYEGTKILLVDGYGRRNYDYTECMEAVDNIVALEDMYEQTLIDAGYCYDKFDISGAGSNQHIHPIEFADYYDCIVWFTGPYFSNYLFDKEAQIALRDFLNDGGKIVLAGDRIAYNMAVVGEDSLGGEFLNGIMGTEYTTEMPGAFDEPYVYLQAVDTVYTTSSGAVPIPMDSLLVYRECPYLKDMSFVIASTNPDSGYTAQALLEVLEPVPAVDPFYADGAVYVEKPDQGGQAVYINYDLCAWVTHQATECDGSHPSGAPTFNQGYYYGRVDLMRTILEDLFNLAPPFPGGGGGTSDTPKQTQFRWALGQNVPNPVASTTEIRFEVASTSNVSIKVYNAMGQLVRTLKNERFQPGRYSVQWDGTNASGEKVSSGVYFYKMAAGKYQATHKMLILK